MRSDAEDQGQAWAVVYDDGMSLTTASEQMARTLADALRQRDSNVTVERVAYVETHPNGAAASAPEPPRPADRVISPEPVTPPIPPSPEPIPAPEQIAESEPERLVAAEPIA